MGWGEPGEHACVDSPGGRGHGGIGDPAADGSSSHSDWAGAEFLFLGRRGQKQKSRHYRKVNSFLGRTSACVGWKLSLFHQSRSSAAEAPGRAGREPGWRGGRGGRRCGSLHRVQAAPGKQQPALSSIAVCLSRLPRLVGLQSQRKASGSLDQQNWAKLRDA